jgi:hypothetical protein
MKQAVVAKTAPAQPELKRSASRFPEVTVPGLGVAQVVLRNWLKIERLVWETIGGIARQVVAVTYFRLRLPSGRFWSFPNDGKNAIPAGATPFYC